MKSNIKPLFYCLTILLITGCSLIKSHPLKEGGHNDVYIDKENEPYLYIDSNPKTKFKFINKLGIDKEVGNILNQWIEIRQLKDQFYFHLSFGPGNINKLIITDYGIQEIAATGDNSEVSPIITSDKSNNNKFSYTIKNLANEKINRKITFYIIDEDNQIAIVEDSDGYIPYTFMIAAQKKYNLPVLINYCRERRLVDFRDFDKVDFKKILKEKGFIE